MRRSKCVVCEASVGTSLGLCTGCSKSYDRAVARDDGTLLSVIAWAARRAWAHAKKKKTKRARRAAGGVGDTSGGLGTPGLRDPGAPCAEYAPGPGHGDCETDGHYLCRGCSRCAAGGGT